MRLLNKKNISKIADLPAIRLKIIRTLFIRKALWIFQGKSRQPAISQLKINQKNKIFFDKSDFSSLIELEKKSIPPEELHNEKEVADAICEHRFQFLSHKLDFKNSKIKWNYDPVSGKTWPDDFSFNIIYKGDQRLSDIKIPWEFAKMQYLFILGKVYLRTGDKKYALEIVRQIDSFIGENRPFKGIHWISALETGARVISWIMIYPFICDHIDDAFKGRFLSEIYSQTDFIDKTISGKQDANTHLIGEAFTLMLAGLFLECKASPKWYRQGYRILLEQIDRQVHADGVHKEQSLNYHRFFLDFYLLFIVLHRQNALRYPESLDLKIQNMTEFIAGSMMPKGGFPNIGDADDARGIYVKSDCEKDFGGILGMAAALFHRNDFKLSSNIATPGHVPQEIIWLLGEKGVNAFNALEPHGAHKRFSNFEHAGYYILRESSAADADYLLFDCGPLCMGVGGHGHADALSIVLCKNGAEFLADPGTYSYNLDYALRDYFRSTRAHNTISIDGSDQSEMKDRMSYRTFAAAKIKIRKETPHFTFIGGTHNGYERLFDPVTVHRYIFYDKAENWIVADYFSAAQAHVYEHNLHLDRGCTVIKTPDRDGRCIVRKNGSRLIINYIDAENCDIRTFKGQHEPLRAGWLSKRYGTMEPSITLSLQKNSVGRTSLLTGFFDSDEIAVRNLAEQAGRIFFQIDDGGNCKTVFFYDIEAFQGKCSDEEMAFEGKLLFYTKKTKDPRNAPDILTAFNFTSYAGKYAGRISSDAVLDKLVIEGNDICIFSKNTSIDRIDLDINPEMRVFFNAEAI